MKKRVYIVPNDVGLRNTLSAAGVVIYTVRLVNGEEVDVCDETYARDDAIARILDRYCEYAEIETVEREW
ncbi:MAG: hypothetical protein ABDH59_08950 [Fervidobacterium sp.]